MKMACWRIGRLFDLSTTPPLINNPCFKLIFEDSAATKNVIPLDIRAGPVFPLAPVFILPYTLPVGKKTLYQYTGYEHIYPKNKRHK